MKGIVGRKLGMTQIFDDAGVLRPVTLIQAGPCTVVGSRTADKDGYAAVQLGFDPVELTKLTKPQQGFFKKAGLSQGYKHLVEIRDPGAEMALGAELTVESFEVGEDVTVSGTSIGKGFAGVVKRHHFGRGDMTHGSKQHRGHGTIGAGTTPGRVFKGVRMSGRLGGGRVTQKGLRVLLVDPARNIIALSGPVPGPDEGLVVINGLKPFKMGVDKAERAKKEDKQS